MANVIYGSLQLPQAAEKLVKITTLEKTDRGQADSVLLATIEDPHADDIAVIVFKKQDVVVSKTAYIYDELTQHDWVALNGEVDASKVIIYDDIVMAGNYTNVGNLTKTQTGTSTFPTGGKSVLDALQQIFTKRLQPTITAQPAVSGFSLTGAGKVEAGTKVDDAVFGTAKLSAGTYTYGPATGVTAQGYTVDRICTPTSMNKNGVVAAASGTDNNDGNGFVIGDQTPSGNVVSSLAYKVTVTHGDGAVANDNLGSPSAPEVKIAAGSKTATTTAYTPFRKYFYGGVVEEVSIDSAGIRTLTGSTGPASNGTKFDITIPEGATQVVIAYPATLRPLTSVKDVKAFGTDIVTSFELQNEGDVQVEGANGYQAIAYKVYVYKPKTALGANTYNVTI